MGATDLAYDNLTLVTYSYDSLNRRTSTTLPDGTTTHTSYTALGQTEATWGSQTYPRFYTYDKLGRMSELRTYQNLAQGTEPTADTGAAIPAQDGNPAVPATYASTTWSYDLYRGWLVSKRDADSKGADYTYSPAGRLKTRTWARGVITTYNYDHGSLSTVAYSDSTPGVSYSYDDFGRPTNVTQGTNIHTYLYDTDTDGVGTSDINDLSLVKENYQLQRIHPHSRPWLRRIPPPENLLKSQENTPPNGDTIPQDVLVKCWNSQILAPTKHKGPPVPAAAIYKYVTGSYRLVESVKSPAHGVSNTYEANRNVLLAKINHLGTPQTPGATIAKFDYEILDTQSEPTGFGANSIGQRKSLRTTGKGFDGSAFDNATATGPGYNWTYNSRGELTQADDPITATNDRAYQYDTIGNRIETVEGTTTLTGTANYTSNALNQYTAINQGSVSVSPAYDSDGNATAYPMPNDQ